MNPDMFPNPKTLARYSLLLATFVQSMHAAEFTSLVHHWNFDEGPDWHDDPFGSIGSADVAQDALGGSDASLMNGPRWVSGRQYSGLMLDGVDDFLELSADLSPSLSGTASLSFWLKTTQTGGATADVAPGLLGSSGIQWGWLDEMGKIALSVDGAEPVRSAVPVNDGEWHHVILTRDAVSGELSVYLDGALSATAVGPVGTRPGAISRIGQMQNGSAVYLRGRLDQIHVFNQAIGAETRQALLENHAPKAWPVHTDGETGGTFTTASVLVNTYLYDAEQDAVSVTRHTQPRHGQVADRGDGSFDYTAAVGFTGQDAFDVWIHDGNGGFTCNTVNIRVTDAAQAGAAQRTTTFADLQVIDAAGSAIALSGWRVPRALDWDGDGDNDLLVGHSSGIWRYENIGSAAAAVFAAGVKVQAGAADISLSGSILIALADFTGDGVDDLVAVNSSREVRVYANTATAGRPPVYAPEIRIQASTGGSFVLPDQRFDAADWDGDGLPDLVTGTRSGNVLFYRNIGTATAPLFDPNQSVVLESGSYNLYPRIFDINRNGTPDCIRGINWGSISFWFDPAPATSLGGSDGSLTITDPSGATEDMKALTDGALVDFADMNGDGVLDVLVGGHAGSQMSVAFGVAATVADSLAAIEAIYDAHASGLGVALEADGQALLGQVNAAAANILMHAAASTLTERRQAFQLMAAHVAKYPFLQMAAPLDTNQFRHLPSIAGQILMTLHHLLPDTEEHRQQVADTMGLIGLHREIYLQMGLHIGDNQRASRGQLESIRDFMRLQPRESFPDAAITLDHYYGDGRGGWVSSFRGAKNTFNFGEGGNVSEWAGDLNAAAESFFGSPVQKGDYFTFVMGHEVTHSLDGYISGRANQDLWRRKGQVMTLAAGPDVLTANFDNYGYWDWNTSKARFQELGYWDGNAANWNQAWENYWSSGPGAVFESLSF
ncbi:MAG: LamG-like jellyroll fold domain-containing protein, partial [Luteolibacter sp.]